MNSLASILGQDDALGGQETSEVRQSIDGQGVEQSALLTYLRDHYDDAHASSPEPEHTSLQGHQHGRSSTYAPPGTPASNFLGGGPPPYPQLITASGQIDKRVGIKALRSSNGRYGYESPNTSDQPHRRSPSPVDPTIEIPSALAELASDTQSSLDQILPQPTIDPVQQAYLDDMEFRGEMGGKRKKPLTERAGWKEMDAEKDRKRAKGSGGPRIGRPRREVNEGVEAFVGYDDRVQHRDPVSQVQSHQSESDVPYPQRIQVTPLGNLPSEMNLGMDLDGSGTLERDLAHARTEMGLGDGLYNSSEAHEGLHIPASTSHQEYSQGVGTSGMHQPSQAEGEEYADSGEDALATGKGRGGKMSHEKRAEQNRKAQQAFRRRREEHMRQLEKDANALGPTKNRLEEVERALREVALMLEASKIELAAVQASFRSFGITTGAPPFLASDGSLVLQASDPKPRLNGQYTGTQIEEAFAKLERQARELAKSRRAKRESSAA